MSEVKRYAFFAYIDEGDNAELDYHVESDGSWVKASDYDQLKADNEAYKKLHDWLKAENEVLTLRVMAGERQELAALKSAPVVMPERRKIHGIINLTDAETYGWNACLDEVERLNGGKP